MPRRRLRVIPEHDRGVLAGLDRIRTEQEVPTAFPPQVEAEARASVTAPSPPGGRPPDRTDIPFVTIDPEGSRDLDQAVHLARRDGGYRVTYAIADVAAFVAAGGAVDAEANRRGVTLYAPDRRTPLHPPVLSEGAASLLPDGDRPALVWEIDLDGSGEATDVVVRRGLVRSRAQLTYEQVQRDLDAGTADEWLLLLREVGTLREERERQRGGTSLPLPDQEVVQSDGHFEVDFRAPLPVERWNAQISLLTGMSAARLMLGEGVGLLRTLPDPPDGSVAALRRTATALGVDWPRLSPWADVVGGLDPAVPAEAALLTRSTRLLRGAGYTAFDGGPPAQAQRRHAALAAEYAHCTAPLRRLVDRYVGEVCLAVCAGAPVPEWVRSMLPVLPETMAAADRRAAAYERACVDLVEAAVLTGREGETFRGVVVDVSDGGGRGTVQLGGPDVLARVEAVRLPLGEEVSLRLVRADVTTRTVEFVLVDG